MPISPYNQEKRKKLREEYKTLSDMKKEGALSSEQEKRWLELETLNKRFPFLHSNEVLGKVVVQSRPETSSSEPTNSKAIPEEAISDKQVSENQLSFGELVDRSYKSLGVDLEA